MINKLRWGVLGTAHIAVAKVIPAMQHGGRSEVTAIASRDLSRAEAVAKELGIAKAYGSYDQLLADDEIEAIYNPLPNHLHVPWTRKAAEAGKNVLCEKPIALNADEARSLLEVRSRTGVRIQEAFMVRTHPQWLATRDLIRNNQIGQLDSITGSFSYYNTDPANIRNKPKMGGGALLDIGCYPINLSRFIFGVEPKRVVGFIQRDKKFGIDRLTTAILDFPTGQCTFTCSTQLAPYQRMTFIGTKGRIEIPIPFNAPNDRPTTILIDDGSSLFGTGAEIIEFPVCDQYTIQGDLFSQAVLENKEQVIPLEDTINNMAVIDAVFRSAATGQWEEID
jgi:predicted dehydrogenase